MAGGRPLKFENVEALQKQIDAFFAEEEKKKRPLTITGLALALDTSRETLMNYEERPEFFDTIKRAKLRVEQDYEFGLRTRGNAGDIFGLKNFGWRDQQHTDITSNNEKLSFGWVDPSSCTSPSPTNQDN